MSNTSHAQFSIIFLTFDENQLLNQNQICSQVLGLRNCFYHVSNMFRPIYVIIKELIRTNENTEFYCYGCTQIVRISTKNRKCKYGIYYIFNTPLLIELLYNGQDGPKRVARHNKGKVGSPKPFSINCNSNTYLKIAR